MLTSRYNICFVFKPLGTNAQYGKKFVNSSIRTQRRIAKAQTWTRQPSK